MTDPQELVEKLGGEISSLSIETERVKKRLTELTCEDSPNLFTSANFFAHLMTAVINQDEDAVKTILVKYHTFLGQMVSRQKEIVELQQKMAQQMETVARILEQTMVPLGIQPEQVS